MRSIIHIIIVIPVISTFITSLVFFGIGVYETIWGIGSILKGQLHTEARPGLVLFEALDMFLIGFLFLIFSMGFAQLFVAEDSWIKTVIIGWAPGWLKVETLTQLKLILWDTLLTTLVVLFAGEAFRKMDGIYDWKLLLFPIAILLISISRFLIKASKKA